MWGLSWWLWSIGFSLHFFWFISGVDLYSALGLDGLKHRMQLGAWSLLWEKRLSLLKNINSFIDIDVSLGEVGDVLVRLDWIRWYIFRQRLNPIIANFGLQQRRTVSGAWLIGLKPFHGKLRLQMFCVDLILIELKFLLDVRAKYCSSSLDFVNGA